MATARTTEESQGFDLVDSLKWLVVWGLVIGGIFGNWYFAEESLLLRALALIGVAAVSAYVLYLTKKGQALWILLNESRAEIRRVVWPTREVTIQTTMIVIALVLIVALILWGLDSLLSWGVKLAIG